MAYIYDLVDSWNSSGTTFTAIKMNVTDTQSSASSLLMDLQVGSASRFKVAKDAQVSLTNNIAAGPSFFLSGFAGNSIRYGMGTLGITGANYDTGYFRLDNGSGGLYFAASTNATFLIDPINSRIGFGSGSAATFDLFLGRRGAANLRLGAADAAVPVAQTLSVQSVATGTANTAGANFTIAGSQGTGTGAGGSIIFQVAPATTNGSTPNTLTNALTINADRSATFAGAITTTGYLNAGGLSLGSSGAGGIFILNDNRFLLNSTGYFAFSNNANVNLDISGDVRLYRDDVNILAQRNGVNPQTFRLYNTFTDSSNYERGYARWNSNVYEVGVEAAGSGITNRSMRVVAGGQLNLQAGAGNSITFNANLLASVDNSFDIGATGASRPRNVFVAGAVTVNGLISTSSDLRAGSTNYFYWNARSQMSSPSDGNILLQNLAATDFNRLQLTTLPMLLFLLLHLQQAAVP
jgi:hypothetical protein